MRVRRTAYNVGLSLMPPDLHISHISFLWQSLSLTKPPHHHLQRHISSAVHSSAHWGVRGVQWRGVGNFKLWFFFFSGQEQLLKCYPAIVRCTSKHTMFHNWLSCPVLFFFHCRLWSDFNFESPKWTRHVISEDGVSACSPWQPVLSLARKKGRKRY